jgi:hypothetical protein
MENGEGHDAQKASAECATAAQLRRRGRHDLSPDPDRTNLIISEFSSFGKLRWQTKNGARNEV